MSRGSLPLIRVLLILILLFSTVAISALTQITPTKLVSAQDDPCRPRPPELISPGDFDPFDPPSEPAECSPPIRDDPPVVRQAPILSFQLGLCLPESLSESALSRLESMIQAFLDNPGISRANGNIEHGCVDGTERIGIWKFPASDTISHTSLSEINIIREGELFAMYFDGSLLRSQALSVFSNVPERWNHNGVPDPNGPTHLQNLFVYFVEPNIIVTQVTGFDEDPWPDVSFRYTITDTIRPDALKLRCDRSTSFDADTSILNFLTLIFTGAGLLELGLLFGVQSIIVNSINPNINAFASVGCGLSEMLNQEFPLPGGKKISLLYTRFDAFIDGVIVAGNPGVPVDRSPRVAIEGPYTAQSLSTTHQITLNYKVKWQDMRPPVQITWTADGSISNPSGDEHNTATTITFDTGPPPGQVNKRIQVTVTDADGLTAQDSREITIYKPNPFEGPRPCPPGHVRVDDECRRIMLERPFE